MSAPHDYLFFNSLSQPRSEVETKLFYTMNMINADEYKISREDPLLHASINHLYNAVESLDGLHQQEGVQRETDTQTDSTVEQEKGRLEIEKAISTSSSAISKYQKEPIKLIQASLLNLWSQHCKYIRHPIKNVIEGYSLQNGESLFAREACIVLNALHNNPSIRTVVSTLLYQDIPSKEGDYIKMLAALDLWVSETVKDATLKASVHKVMLIQVVNPKSKLLPSFLTSIFFPSHTIDGKSLGAK